MAKFAVKLAYSGVMTYTVEAEDVAEAKEVAEYLFNDGDEPDEMTSAESLDEFVEVEEVEEDD